MGALPPDFAWSPEDDLLLINAVKARVSLESLVNGAVQFSRIYNVQELQDRWQTLLYEFQHSASTTQFEFNTFEHAMFDSVDVNDLGGAGNNDDLQLLDCMFIDPVIDNFCNEQSNFNVEYGAWDFINASDGVTASSAFSIGQNSNVDVSLDSFSFQEFPYGIEEALPPAENHETIATIGGSFQHNEQPAMANHFDETQVFTTTAFPRSVPSFQNFGYSPIPPRLPEWSIIPDTPVPTPHVFDQGGTELTLQNTLVAPVHQGANEMNTSGCCAVTDQISSDILRNSSHNTDERIAKLSNVLLDVNDDDKLVYTGTDGNEMSDASNFDFRSFLLDAPVEDNMTDKGVSGISKAPVQQPMLSSALSVDHAFPEIRDGVINCTLNTEELEVPNNDDIFLPVKTLSTSSALMAHNEYKKTHHERNFMTGHQPIESNYSGMKYQLEKPKRTINRIKWAPDACTQIPIAVVHGRHSRHLIRKTRVVLGKASEHVKVDIDLSKEDPDCKISRRQAIIKMDVHGVFYLLNIGKCPVHVNGFELLPKQSLTLTSGFIITVRDITLTFERNRSQITYYLEDLKRSQR